MLHPAPPSVRTSAAAVTSLVLGLLMCIPLIGGLLAIIFGIVGLRTTRDPRFTGRGLAVAGLILGMVNLIGWGAAGYVFVARTVAAAAVAERFAQKLASGDLSGAATETAGISQQQLASVAAQMQPWGAVSNVSFNRSHVNINGSVELEGTAHFTVGSARVYRVELVKIGGQLKVRSFNFQ
jgi:hypothetical protein